MKTEEDEAFDELAKRQGAWGSGYQAKRAMAADKLQEPEREALNLALEALDIAQGMLADLRSQHQPKMLNAYTTIKEALAQPAQEPVTTVTSESGNPDVTMSWWHEPALPVGTPLYTYPQKREWVGLTAEEICAIYLQHHNQYGECESPSWGYERAIEQALKEKNNGT